MVVLPGSTRRARHYAALAEALSDSYTVHVVERRGRGRSPAQDAAYSLDVEISDALEVLSETGSRQIFGHSYGGLIALHTGLRTDLDRVIAYEPAVSIDGSMPSGWMPRYERLLSEGKDARAMICFFHSMEFLPGGPLATAVAWAMTRFTAEGRATRELLPTVLAESGATKALDSGGERYAGITAPVLLLGGGRSPAYLSRILPLLVETIPDAKLIMTPEFDHNAPDLSAPAPVADLIRA
ncbi:alpha/beta hydrolase [Paractinoplanes ferrugineus]|uniref:Alpha/beta hydrolase n=1 Tax=Paractinoplanes ferrugineus TaxID=113564 RepID=A0A919IXD4_9ACTN|nr:alpha/beta hydrolase [Actinoplanes ferrugineus]